MTNEWIVSGLLYLFSGAFLLLVLWKWFQFYRAGIHVEDFMNGLRNVLKRKHFSEAITLCDNTPGPVARVVCSVLSAYWSFFETEKKEESDVQHLKTEVKTELQTQVNHELRDLEHWMNWFPALGFASMGTGILCAVYWLWKSHNNLEFQALKAILDKSFGLLFFGVVLSILYCLTYHYFLNWITRFCRDMEDAIVQMREILQDYPESEQISCMEINTKLRPLGFVSQVLPFLSIVVVAFFIYFMFQESRTVQGVTISKEQIVMKNAMEKRSIPSNSIITVLGEDTYSFRDKRYHGSKEFEDHLREKGIANSDRIFFILKSEINAQAIMGLVDLAKHLGKDAFIIVEKQKVQSATETRLMEGD